MASIGANARGVRGDVADLADIDALYDVVQNEARAIDALFANAGRESFRTSASGSRELAARRANGRRAS